MKPEQMLALALSKVSDLDEEKLAHNLDQLSVEELAEIFNSEKTAFSITREGHDFDADRASIRGEAAAKEMELSQRHHGMGSAKRTGNLGRALRFGTGNMIDPRHEEYVEKKHREGKNAWNPFGGAMTPSKHERNGSTLQYGEMDTGHKFTHEDKRPKKDDKEKKSSVDQELDLEEKISLADQWGRELAKTAGPMTQMMGKGLNTVMGASHGMRAAVGAGVGAAGGAASYAMQSPQQRQNSSLMGRMAGGAALGAGAGLGAKPALQAAGGMNNQVGMGMRNAMRSNLRANPGTNFGAAQSVQQMGQAAKAARTPAAGAVGAAAAPAAMPAAQAARPEVQQAAKAAPKKSKTKSKSQASN